MFSRQARSFNQPLNKWNVSKVTDMESMFSGATSFNQPLNKWNVSKVTDMSYMFGGATSFNHRRQLRLLKPLSGFYVNN